MPLERLTMLVVPRDGDATMVIPRLEAPRVVEQPGVFDLLPWGETEDPTALVGKLSSGSNRIAVGDQMWARFLVELLPHVPGAEYQRAVDVVGALRMTKDQAEIDALTAAGAAVDKIAGELQRGEIELVGRTEAAVSAELSRRIVAEGHDKVNFAIVAAGENAASPHHHAGDRVIRSGEIVLCDFGGTMAGYCSDTTRCVFTGDVAPDVAEAYAVLLEAQAVGVAAGIAGTPCEDIDRATRQVIADAGYGEYFIHRTGHGIGMEEHEDPYIVEGNSLPARAGSRVQRGAGDLHPRQVGHAPRRHRRRHRRRPGVAEQLRSPPRQRLNLARFGPDPEPGGARRQVGSAGGELGFVDRVAVRGHLDEQVGAVVPGERATLEGAVADRSAGDGHVDAQRLLVGLGDGVARRFGDAAAGVDPQALGEALPVELVAERDVAHPSHR